MDRLTRSTDVRVRLGDAHYLFHRGGELANFLEPNLRMDGI
jgi:hypothetical protein